MAYSNPTIDALSRGGATANQGMSVANSMLQGVMHAMDSTSDMAFRLDKLLRDEQARKIEQGLKTQQFLENQYQFDITSRLDKDKLAAQEKQWRTANTLANKKYELDEKKFEYEKEQDAITDNILKNIMSTGKATDKSNGTVPNIIPPILESQELSEDRMNEIKSQDVPDTLDMTPFKPSIAPVGITFPEATPEYYNKAQEQINNEIMNKQNKASQLQSLATGSPKAYKKLQPAIQSLNTDINMLKTKSAAYEQQQKNVDEIQKAKNLVETKTKTDTIIGELDKVLKSKYPSDTNKYKDALDKLEQLKMLRDTATTPEQKTYIDKTIETTKDILSRKFAPATTGYDFATNYFKKNKPKNMSRDQYMNSFTQKLRKGNIDPESQKVALKTVGALYDENKKLQEVDAKFKAKLNSKMRNVNPNRDEQDEIGQWTLIDSIYNKGNPTTKKLLAGDGDKNPGIVDIIDQTEFYDTDDLFGYSLGTDNEELATDTLNAALATDELRDIFKKIFSEMKNADLFKTWYKDDPDDDDTLDSLSPDEATVFMMELSELMAKPDKDVKAYSDKLYNAIAELKK